MTMQSFFSPHSKRLVSRPVALVLNTANLLGPCLLVIALILLATVAFDHNAPEAEQFFTNLAAALIAAAIIIRIIWGIAIARIRKADTPQ